MKKISPNGTALSVHFKLIVFIIVLLSASLNSCKKQADPSNTKEQLSGNEPARIFVQRPVPTVSYQTFLDSVRRFAPEGILKVFAAQTVINGQLRVDNQGNNSIILCTDSIKLMRNAGHTTYTIPIKQFSETEITFRNVVLDFFEGNISTYLVTYTPDSTFLNNHIKGIKGKFSGKVHAEPFNFTAVAGKIQTASVNLNPNGVQVCTTLFIYDGAYAVLCPCNNHMPGDTSCDCPQGPGYWQAVYAPVTFCEDITISFTNPNLGGGSVGGGGAPPTSPTPPPGYDPCAPAVSSTIKIQVVDGPSPCTPTVPPVNPPVYSQQVQALVNLFQLTGDNINFLVANPGFANDLFNQLEADGYAYESRAAAHMTILASAANVLATSNDVYHFNVVSPALPNQPIITAVLYGRYMAVQCAMIKVEHPDWSDWKIYWEASKEIVHLLLDGVGLAPGLGEIADLANGLIYTIEGDGVNASLSYASAIPVAGWFAAGAKFAKKGLALADGTKTTLKWVVKANNFVSFGDRAQLRKVIGLAVGDLRQAHHILPWGHQAHWAIQKAAKSKNAFHMNSAANGIALDNAVHLGSHRIYDDNVLRRLSDIDPKLTPEQTVDAIQDIITDIRNAIINHPNTHVNDLIF